MAYVWYKAYKAAVLETDWTKMQERLHSAENANGRQGELSMNHGGTPEERQALAAAMSGLSALRKDLASWQGTTKTEAYSRNSGANNGPEN